MRASKTFFNKLRDEIKSRDIPTPVSAPKKTFVSIDSILKDITWYTGDNLDQHLKSIDWFSVNPEELIPRERIRDFAKRIYKIETRLQVLKFLLKYEDYYFKDVEGVIGCREILDYYERPEMEEIIGIKYTIADFDKELRVLIEQIESDGEFSTGKIDKLNAKVISLEAKIKELEKKIGEKDGEIAQLKAEKDKNEKYIMENNEMISLDAICNYAKKLTREETKTIRDVLFNIMDITDKTIKEKISAIKSITPEVALNIGDIVDKKYVNK